MGPTLNIIVPIRTWTLKIVALIMASALIGVIGSRVVLLLKFKPSPTQELLAPVAIS